MMGFRFRKSISLAPGVRLNVSKSGTSWSLGRRGATVNVGKRGVYADLGIPGTGLSYRERVAAPSSPSGRRASRPNNVFRLLVLVMLFGWIVGMAITLGKHYL